VLKHEDCVISFMNCVPTRVNSHMVVKKVQIEKVACTNYQIRYSHFWIYWKCSCTLLITHTIL